MSMNRMTNKQMSKHGIAGNISIQNLIMDLIQLEVIWEYWKDWNGNYCREKQLVCGWVAIVGQQGQLLLKIGPISPINYGYSANFMSWHHDIPGKRKIQIILCIDLKRHRIPANCLTQYAFVFNVVCFFSNVFFIDHSIDLQKGALLRKKNVHHSRTSSVISFI